MDATVVRNCLKSRILQRRRDIVVDFTPKPLQPMTIEEMEKDRRRKESNKRSARRSRQKLKFQDEQNKTLLDQESNRRDDLMNRLRLLEGQKQKNIEILRTNGVSEAMIQAYLQKALVEFEHDKSNSVPSLHEKARHPGPLRIAFTANLSSSPNSYIQSNGTSTTSYSLGSRSTSPSICSDESSSLPNLPKTIFYEQSTDSRSSSEVDSYENVFSGSTSSVSPSTVSDSCDEERGNFIFEKRDDNCIFDRRGDESNFEYNLATFSNQDVLITLVQSLTGYQE